MTAEQIGQLQLARDAAHAAAKAATDLARFLDGASAEPDPAELAEFAVLLAREEAIRSERDDACDAIGLSAPSIE